MGRASRSKIRKELDLIEESGYVDVYHENKRCDRCDKVLYNSKHDARRALMTQMRSKTIRAYECPEFRGRYHVTKEQRERWARKG